MATDIEMLNKHFAGKTIARVEYPSINVSECVGQFVCTDGSVFRLHANDLGVWISGTVKGSPDRTYNYKDFDTFMEDVSQHTYFMDSEIQLELFEGVVRVNVEDGVKFHIDFTDLSEETQRIFKHPEGLGRMQNAISLGKGWRVLFTANFECPEELRLDS
jgi:hypothetical protein